MYYSIVYCSWFTALYLLLTVYLPPHYLVVIVSAVNLTQLVELPGSEVLSSDIWTRCQVQITSYNTSHAHCDNLQAGASETKLSATIITWFHAHYMYQWCGGLQRTSEVKILNIELESFCSAPVVTRYLLHSRSAASLRYSSANCTAANCKPRCPIVIV